MAQLIKSKEELEGNTEEHNNVNESELRLKIDTSKDINFF